MSFGDLGLSEIIILAVLATVFFLLLFTAIMKFLMHKD